MNRKRLAYRPVFLQNLCDFWFYAKDAEDKLALLVIFAPLGLKWLDRVTVKGDEGAERAARCLLRLMRSYAHWEHLGSNLGALKDIVQLHKRLNGLVGRGDRHGEAAPVNFA